MKQELTSKIFNKYLAYKYLYITERSYPSESLQYGERPFCIKLDKKIRELPGFNSQIYYGYKKEFWNKGIRDSFILEYIKNEINYIEENYDIPTSVLAL